MLSIYAMLCFPHFLRSQPLLSLQSCYTWLLNAPIVHNRSNLRNIHTVLLLTYKQIHHKMSQAPQSPPVFVHIHMNNGRRVGFRTFSDILDGRFKGDKQLAFEQYLGDFQTHGTTYRTYRYSIFNGDMFLLHGVLDPLTTGPALAAHVTQPGSQYPDAQTQGSAYQKPYASQPNQPMANFPGLVDPSTVPTMRYAGNNALMSISKPRQLNPHASEFKFGAAVDDTRASARSTALPRANSAPTYPPGLPVTQHPRSASSNVRPGYYGPDPLPVSYHPYAASRREAAKLAAEPQWGMPSNTPIRLTYDPMVPQQHQSASPNPRQGGLTLDTRFGQSYNDYGEAAGAPTSPPALAHNYSTASQESWMASPSPLNLDAVSSSELYNPHLSPRPWGRRTSEHSSDRSSQSSSVQGKSTSFWANPRHIINWSSHSAARGSVPKANNTINTSHSPQNGETNIEISPYPPTLPGQPRPSFDDIMQHGEQVDFRPSRADRAKYRASKPLSKLLGDTLSYSPRPQLHYGEERSISYNTSHLYPHPTVDAQLEAQIPAGWQQEDPRLKQRLIQNILDLNSALEEHLIMRTEAEEAFR